jgi:uracil-DNA glycosylase
MTAALEALLTEIRACTLCAAHLPLGPRPILRAKPSARLMIVGQAPGTKVHESGIPWNDPSGDRLRDWLAIDREAFYDETRIAIVPMGFCYPGRAKNGGDNPPRPECAPTWHERVIAHLPALELIVLAGAYAQRHYLADRGGRTMTETVAAWRDYAPRIVPLPHPSWRTRAWVKKNPWFQTELLPPLRDRVAALVG